MKSTYNIRAPRSLPNVHRRIPCCWKMLVTLRRSDSCAADYLLAANKKQSVDLKYGIPQSMPSNGSRRRRSLPEKAVRFRRSPLILAAARILVLAAAVWLLLPRHEVSIQPAAVPAQFNPTMVNSTSAPGTAPEEMVWIPGGEFSMGANDPPDMNDVGMKATLDARPIHRVYVDVLHGQIRCDQRGVREFHSCYRLHHSRGT